MTHLDFADYHNKKIEFVQISPLGKTESKRGLITISDHPLEYNSNYCFIEENDMIKWKLAETRGDVITQISLEETIRVNFIDSAKLI